MNANSELMSNAAEDVRSATQRGIALYHQREFESARSLLSTASERDDGSWECFQFLGRACFRLRKAQEAISAFERVIQIRPAVEPQYELGMVHLLMCDDVETATGYFLRCIQTAPGEVSGYKGLASCVVLEECPEKRARQILREARVAFNADLLLNSLSEALIDAGRLDEALENCREQRSSVLGGAQRDIDIARIWQILGKTEYALDSLDKALQAGKRSPIIAHRALFQLCATGRYQKAQVLYQTLNRFIRFRNLFASLRFSQPEIDGSPVTRKTVLLRTDQMGHGDILQFVRFARELKRRGANVLIVAPANLCPLLRQCEYIDEVSSTFSGLPPYDFEEHLLFLWLALNLGTSEILTQAPYLPLGDPPSGSPGIQASTAPGLAVGFNWSGSDLFQSKRHGAIYRSIPLEQLRPICGSRGITPFCLQAGPAREELERCEIKWGSMQSPLGDFLHLASAIQSLELVVTVDTAVAHLAGALGKRAFVLLPFAAEWRWMSGRVDSPFYPSMQLFRQERPGDWSAPINAIRQRIEMFERGTESSPTGRASFVSQQR